MARSVQSELPLVGRGPAAPARGLALLAIGFRPFFLLAALAAVLLVPAWLSLLLLGVSWPSPLLGPQWHAHEMLFGYTSAVIAGFLLTAVQNWTGQVTARGGWLLALVALWLAGRLASFALGALPAIAAAVDLAFLPALALCIARPIARTRNKRNAAMPLLLLVLALADALFWLGALRPDPLALLRGQRLALDAIAMLIVVIGGRIIPGFTANAVPGLRTRSHGALDLLGIAAMAALLAVDLADPQSSFAGSIAALAGASNLARLWGWGGARTFARPILLVLHAGFASTACGLLLRALALHGGPLVESTATHLLTVGGIGLMTLGMMARVALGHTGRPLTLSPSIVVAIAAVFASALLRVLGAVLLSAHYAEVLIASGALWTLGFALFLVRYTPILLAPRPDGRPG
jgi:uncharacterized protein involved in response to NO